MEAEGSVEPQEPSYLPMTSTQEMAPQASGLPHLAGWVVREAPPIRPEWPPTALPERMGPTASPARPVGVAVAAGVEVRV